MSKGKVSFIIIFIMIGIALPSVVMSDGSDSIKDNYVVQVNSVTIAEPHSRAGGLPAYEVDDRIKDCARPPRCAEPVKKEAVKRQENVVMALNVRFDTGKSFVREEYDNDIRKVADFMKEFPDQRAVIEGYTDSRGDERYNRTLSGMRAGSVRRILIEKYGIDGSRIAAVGHGDARPVASNDSAEGRKKNRRIETFLDAVRVK